MKGKKIFTRVLSYVLMITMLITGIGGNTRSQAKGSENDDYIYLEKATMPKELQAADSFYVATTSGDLKEDSDKAYILTIGRGGDAASGASVSVKLSDATARYGEDYVVKVKGDRKFLKADPGVGNILDYMSLGEFEGERPFSEEEEREAAEKIIEATSGSAAAYREARRIEKGLKSDNPLKQMKENVTGISSDRESMVNDGSDMLSALSEIGNYLTEKTIGNSLEVDFKPGEKEKEIVIKTKNNKKSDGDRFFYMVLSAPSDGTAISAISESIFTIKDDEPTVKAKIGFAKSTYTAEDGSVKIKVFRKGAENQTVSARLISSDDTARAGFDYEGVNADLIFPFGVTEREVTLKTFEDKLSVDAKYNIRLSKGAGTSITDKNRASVILPAGEKEEEAKSNKLKPGYEEGSKTLDNIHLSKKVIDLTNIDSGYANDVGYTYKTYDNLGMDNKDESGQTEMKVVNENGYDCLQLYAKDTKADWPGNGIIQANTRLVSGTGDNALVSIYDGVRYNWKVHRSSGVNGTSVVNSIWSIYNADNGNTTSYNNTKGETVSSTNYGKRIYESAEGAWQQGEFINTDFIFGMVDVFSVGFRVHAYDYSQWYYLRSITPILRPYRVGMVAADGITMYSGADPATYVDNETVKTNLEGEHGGVVTVYGEEGQSREDVRSININATSVGQNARLVGAKIVKCDKDNRSTTESESVVIENGNSEDEKYITIESNKLTVRLSNKFVRKYKDYISYETIAGSVAKDQDNAFGVARHEGFFNIQPVFERVELDKRKVKLDVNDSVRHADGSLINTTVTVNGKQYSMTSGGTYDDLPGYAIGDRITFKAECNDSAWVCDGIEIYRDGKNVRDKLEYFDPQTNSKTIQINSDVDWKFVPHLVANNNKMVIRVRDEDIPKFKPTGYFAPDVLAKSEKNTKFGYTEITVATTAELNRVTEVYLVAEPNTTTKNGVEVPVCAPVWKETNDDNMYTGNSLLATNKGSAELNVIWLYAGDVSSLRKTKLHGNVYYENRPLTNQKYENESRFPAAGAVLVCGSGSSPVDAFGEAQTEEFYIPDSVKIYDTDMGVTTRVFNSDYSGNYLYAKVKASTGNGEKTESYPLNYNGTTEFGVLTVPVNSHSSPWFDYFEVKNDGLVVSYVEMNDIVSDFETQIVWPEGNTEKVEKVEIVIVDGDTFEEKNTFTMNEQAVGKGRFKYSKTFLSTANPSDYDEGDRVYLRMTTDKPVEIQDNTVSKTGATGADADLFKNMDEDTKEALNHTTYALVPTGYMLSVTGREVAPPVQTVNLPDMNGLKNVPMAVSLDATFKFGPVDLELTTLKDDDGLEVGERLEIGIDQEWIQDKIRSSYSSRSITGSAAYWDGTASGNYDDLKMLVDHLDSFKGTWNLASNQAKSLKDTTKNKSRKPVSIGPVQWGIFPQFGAYIDFGPIREYDKDTGELISERLELMGGGIFFGAIAKVAVNWYAVIPVVYIPCYWGVSGTLTFMNYFWGQNTDNPYDEKGKSMDQYQRITRNIPDDMSWAYQMDIGVTVQVFAGVGINGCLGIRGGLKFKMEFLWYPNLHDQLSYFSETGGTITGSFYVEVDVLIGTISVGDWGFLNYDFYLLDEQKRFKALTEAEQRELLALETKEEQKEYIDARVDSYGNRKTSKGGKDEIKESTKKAPSISLKERTTPGEWSGELPQISPYTAYAAADIPTAGKASDIAARIMGASYQEDGTTLLKNGYDRPNTKLLDMGDQGTLMAFLQEDNAKGDAEFTTLSYSIYKDGKFSEPVKIQIDKTADFMPDICDAGDSVIFAWVSSPDDSAMSGRSGWTEGDGNMAEYLLKQEIYTVKVPKSTLAAGGSIDQSTIVRLTDDINYPIEKGTRYFDYMPKIAYDDTSGSYCIYYIKSGYDTGAKVKSAVDLANPMSISGETYSAIMYRIYDATKGEWVVDDVKSGENMGRYKNDTAAYKKLMKQIGGQRFLQSVINGGKISKKDPLIADFNVLSYGGYTAFAYSVDWDNSIDTDEDRDLYIQFYEHSTRKSTDPIRVTDDKVTDSMPELVRRPGKSESYLFWKRDGGLYYFDLTEFIEEGLTKSSGNVTVRKALIKNGSLMSTDASTDSGYHFHASSVDSISETENEKNSFNAYKLETDDKGNLYVVWIANAHNGEVNGDVQMSQEIFATAMIDGEVVRDGKTYSQRRWAPANQMTHAGNYCDEPAIAVTGNGDMILVYNNYDIGYDATYGTGNDAGKVSYSNARTENMTLKASRLKLVGSVEVADLNISENMPKVGDDVTVDITFINRGLTTARDGFTADIYEENGGTKYLIDSYTSAEGLAPSDWVSYSLTYKATDSTIGSHILVEVRETGLEGICGSAVSEDMIRSAKYHITDTSYYQDKTGEFFADIKVKNDGNATSVAGDKLELLFAGPYRSAKAFGVSDTTYATRDIVIAPGEEISLEKIPLNIPHGAFELYGRMDVCAVVSDKSGDSDGVAYSESSTIGYAALKNPFDVKINNGKDVTIELGEELSLGIEMISGFGTDKPKAIYHSTTHGIGKIRNDKAFIPKKVGTTTIRAYLPAYGREAEINVNVVKAGAKKVGRTKVTGFSSRAKRKLSVKAKKVSKSTGYEVLISKDKTFKKGVKKVRAANSEEANFKKVAKGKWYVKARSYVEKNYIISFGNYSKVKSVSTKKKRPVNVAKKTIKIKAGKAKSGRKLTVTWKKPEKSTGVSVIIATDKKGKNVIASRITKSSKAVFKKLKAGKRYYVIIQSYKKYGGNYYVYSSKKIVKRKKC